MDLKHSLNHIVKAQSPIWCNLKLVGPVSVRRSLIDSSLKERIGSWALLLPFSLALLRELSALPLPLPLP